MLKKSLFKSLAVLLIVFMAVTMWGCTKKTAGEKNSGTQVQTELDKIKQAGKIVVGTSADYPPYDFYTEVNGKEEIVGFDIDIAKEIAKDLGVQLEIKNMDFKGLLAALQTGNVDFVIAGMTPTPERAQQVNFSTIYYTAKQGVIVRTDQKDKIKTMADLKGKKVGVQKGTIQEQIAQEQLKDSTTKGLGKVSDLILDLKAGNIDAIIVELPVAEAYINRNNDLSISDIKIETGEEGSAVAVRKDSTELLTSVNKTLSRLMENKDVEKFFATASEIMDK